MAVLLTSSGFAQDAITADARDRLTVSEMFGEDDLGQGPVDNRYFVPMGQFGPAKHDLSATLIIPEEARFRFGAFPDAAVNIFRSGNRLIPATRDIIRGGGKAGVWNLIFSPGRVWSEPGDGGFSRASFPFVLAHTVWNEAHNGIATFLYDDTTVSPLVFQIVQETSPIRRLDAWGRLPISLQRGWIENRDRIADEYAREIQERLPVRRISSLATDFGDHGQDALNGWPQAWNESVSGLVINGVIYVGTCQTRFGPYPFCDEMRHGVFSMTKSLGALLAMLRLAQKYGDGIFEMRIKDYVEVSASHAGWNEVTFADALNMATGIGDGPVKPTRVFEDGDALYREFMFQPSARDKLATAFSGNNYPWGPGQAVRYRSIDTFVLAAAMDGFLKSREGPHANIWDLVRVEVLHPIGVFHAPMMHTVEPDGGRGIPILGEGIFPTFHDIAKIALLFQSAGKYHGEQLLSATKLREALYQIEIRGLQIPANISPLAGSSYHMSFWHAPMVLGQCSVNVARMLGWGRNMALLMPSGMVAFFVQDGYSKVEQELASAANALRPECP